MTMHQACSSLPSLMHYLRVVINLFGVRFYKSTCSTYSLLVFCVSFFIYFVF